ncbi:MAG TPA: AAA family ATPase [Trebonia sp.]|nr:AAA family ATPase [Trebonia sp.]
MPADLFTELLGRHEECTALASLIDRVRGGESAALVLRGDPGAGKSALLDYAAGLATDLRVLRVTGRETEAALPYAGLHQLCGPLLGLLEHLPGPQRDALETVFGLRGGPAPERVLVGLAVLSLLARAADEGPLALVTDDAHSLDRASARALAFAARRLPPAPVLMIFTARRPDPDLAGLPELVVGGLCDADARALLASLMRCPLDERVRDQVVAETRGNPGTLADLLHGLSPVRLAGGFGLLDALRDRADEERAGEEDETRRKLRDLPGQARTLLLLAAADPTGDPALLWRAAQGLGIPGQPVQAAAAADLISFGISFGSRVVFPRLATRLAAYWSAPPPDRAAAHAALAAGTDPRTDPDRRAWHRARATQRPSEDIAADLERTAARARARGGIAAAAAFLERAAALTPGTRRRGDRAIAAAEALLQAGASEAGLRVLSAADAGTCGGHQRACADVVCARLAGASGRDSAVPLVLLRGAARLERFDAGQARAAYLDAMDAAMTAGTLAAPGGDVTDVARRARATPPVRPSRAPDLLLDGLAACFADGYPAGVPVLRRALDGFGRGMSPAAELRWLGLASAAARLLWDDQAWDTLSGRHVRLAREAGALGELPLALASRAEAHLLAGELATAAALLAEARAVTGANPASSGALALEALRGQGPDEFRVLVGNAGREAALHGEGLLLTTAHWAAAVHANGLGRYAEALSAAGQAGTDPGAPAGAELIEAAARTGEPGRATGAMRHLSGTASAAGTSWALGVEARSRALLTEGEAAEDLYQEAIRHLGKTRALVDLARARLLYGEWLRRERRRVDARDQLRTAHEALAAMGVAGFAQRARRELLATGETARKRRPETATDLTAQEWRVAVRAREGRTNTEIGAEFYLSPRTVEWHLSKVFAKLGITSRRHLQRALPAG